MPAPSIDDKIQPDVPQDVQILKTRSTINNYTSTMTDVLNDVMGGDGAGFSTITLDTNLSSRMTRFFTNTNVSVYVYQSKLCRTLTVPGVNEYMKPESVRAVALDYDHNKYLTNHISMLRAVEARATFWSTMLKDGGFSKLSFDPTTKKFSINLENITIYITSAYINLLDGDELTAVLLHEIACNLMLGRDTIISIISGASSLITMLVWFITHFNISDGTPHIPSLIASFAIMASTVLFVKYAALYFVRKSEIYMDEFVIKCGYGKYLESAIKKYHQFVYDYDSQEKAKVVDSYNLVDKVTQGWDRLGAKIMNFLAMLKLTKQQERTEREKMIATKTASYDTSDSNTDRSAHI